MKKSHVYFNVPYRFICLLLSLSQNQTLFSISAVNPLDTDYNNSWHQELESFYYDKNLEIDSWTFLIEELNGIHLSGININQTSREELERLNFLNATQIEDIVAYIYFNNEMKTLGELQLIPSLDYQTRSLLKHFLYTGVREENFSIDLKNIAQYGRQEIILRSDIPFYTRSGYKNRSVEELNKYPNRSYLGGPLAHSIRYSFNYKNRVLFGLLAENDAGEPFFKSGNRGYDYYSPYFFLSDIKFLKCLVVGKFRVGFGRGLVINSGFNLGKSFLLSNMDRGLSGIKPHSSLSEYGYFKGLGATIKAGKIEISTLCSRNSIDATLSGNRIKSIKKDGYHRTPLEYSKKGNTKESVVALHVARSHNGIHIGSTAQYVLFDRYLAPGAANYQRYNPVGYKFFSASIDYAIFRSQISFSGEVALSDGGGFATINSMSKKIGHSSKLLLLHRLYSSKYHSFHSSSFAEGAINNEVGIYTGLSGKKNRWDYDTYIDLFYFPFMRYSASAPSNGLEARVQLARLLNRAQLFTIGYKFKAKQSNTPIDSHLAYKKHHRFRITLKNELTDNIKIQSQIHYVGYQFYNNSIKNGFAISESVDYISVKSISLNFSTSIFFTDSYDSSISIYEKGPLYAFNYQTLSGRGQRLSLLLRYNMTKNFLLMIKMASMYYYDRQTIGSSEQTIESNHKEDLYIQIKYKF